MNSIFFRQINNEVKIIIIFLFTFFLLGSGNIYAATNPKPAKNTATRNTKTYTRASWSVKCAAAGGECVSVALYGDGTNFEKKEVDCDTGKKYVCVTKDTNKGLLCNRCSDEYGCKRASFYTNSTTCDASAKPVTDSSGAITNKSTDLKYVVDTECGKIDGKDNSACQTTSNGCNATSPDCVSSPCDATANTCSDFSCTTADGKEGKCAKSKVAKSTCTSPNQCISGTTCSNGSVINATCSTAGQICCPATNANTRCTSPNQCVSATSTGSMAACVIGGRTFPVDCSTGMSITGANGVAGSACLIYNTAVQYSCSTGRTTYGMNSGGCQGTIVSGTCNNGQVCCSQASSNIFSSLAQSLSNGISGLMNKLFGTSSSTTPSIYSPTETPTPTVSVTPTSIPALGSLNNANGVDVTFNLKLKFHGVVGQPSSELNKLKVLVTIVDTSVTSGTKSATSSGNFVVSSVASGSASIWTGSVSFTKVEPKQTYKLYIKGPKYVQKRVCVNSPTETYAGQYSCDTLLNVVAGNNDLDLSNIYMMAGDVPKQDGVVNSVDFGTVRTKFGKLDYTSLNTADLNLDGAINSVDFSLILATLQATDGVDQQ